MGPGSVWENGMPWMTGSLTAAIEADIIKPASELRVTDNEEKEYEKLFNELESLPSLYTINYSGDMKTITKKYVPPLFGP